MKVRALLLREGRKGVKEGSIIITNSGRKEGRGGYHKRRRGRAPSVTEAAMHERGGENEGRCASSSSIRMRGGGGKKGRADQSPFRHFEEHLARPCRGAGEKRKGKTERKPSSAARRRSVL